MVSPDSSWRIGLALVVQEREHAAHGQAAVHGGEIAADLLVAEDGAIEGAVRAGQGQAILRLQLRAGMVILCMSPFSKPALRASPLLTQNDASARARGSICCFAR